MATSKMTEVATANNMPVRLRTAGRSLPGWAGAGDRLRLVLGPSTDLTGGTGGGVPGAPTPVPATDIDGSAGLPRASFNVSFRTFRSRRVSKLTGFISTACRRVKADRPFGNS